MKMKGFKQLFTDFPDITTTEWEEKIKADLKGTEYQKKLIWKTDEGFEIKPYYRREDLKPLNYLENFANLKSSESAPNGWTICQDVFPGKNLQAANKQIKSALKGGAQAIRVQLKDSPLPSLEMLGTLLEGVPLGETELLFQGYLGADILYDQLCELAKASGVDPCNLKGSLGADPMGKMAVEGIPIASLENIGKLVIKVRETSPEMRIIDINGALIQNSGSTLVEELGFSMAMINEYMALLTAQGIDPLNVQASLQLSLSVGSNYFMEIAKLRASRILLGKIGEAYGINPSDGNIRIHSTSSEWNLTLFDPYVNMLRGTTEAMSSILGGADLVSVLPFDYPYGKVTEFSSSIARNVQIILREEAYFDRVTDPASGSYYIENLTDSIGEKSWELFREVESKGGFRKAFESGWIQEQVVTSRKKKIERTASGRGKILGTNTFPHFNEMILENLNTSVNVEYKSLPLKPLIPFRLSSIFEEVRIETERSNNRPKVLLFKYGNPAWMTARAAFSGNFFACAGYEILDPPAYASVETGIQAVKDENADIVVLCSSDDAYAELAPAVHNAIKDRSAVVVAGYPSDSVEKLRKAGIEHFIHIKSNHLEILKKFNSKLL